MLHPLMAISCLDGRYNKKTQSLQDVLSEYGLIKYRLIVEINWLITLSSQPEIAEVPALSEVLKQRLLQFIEQFDLDQAIKVKEHEAVTAHDVKALEYYLKDLFDQDDALKDYKEFIHFACTSEDINNLAYALMIQDTKTDIILPMLEDLHDLLVAMGLQYQTFPMLAKTHGQPASPTTLGKEILNVSSRLNRQIEQLKKQPILGKINGATGNFNAHVVAYPQVDWPQVARSMVESLGLEYNPMTTQIEPHDYMAEIMHIQSRINTILIDFCRDVWAYISIGYFNQKTQANEVGSSTMPHKVNPIDFENAEGNLGLANALLSHMAGKLPISRWQRDLTDSTVLRNLGTCFGHVTVALSSLCKGLNKLTVNRQALDDELEANWAVLAEAIQTLMRKEGHPHPYETLKALTRGEKIDAAKIQNFIQELSISPHSKQQLMALTPHTYIGLAEKLGGQDD